MEDETYVRRRHWSSQEKRAVVEEALTSGNVVGTAKRHGIQAQQIYRWRERLDDRQGPATFLALSVASEPVTACPAPVLGRAPRVEIVLSSCRRIIVEGSVDVDAVLKLARGLEALR